MNTSTGPIAFCLPTATITIEQRYYYNLNVRDSEVFYNRETNIKKYVVLTHIIYIMLIQTF